MKGILKPVVLCVAMAIVTAVTVRTVQAKEWLATVGAESPDRGSQALAFLPNEIWIHAGDSIRWTFQTHERHTLTFLKPGQTRPPGFGPIFGIVVGCPGVTPDGSSFDGSACVTSDVLLLNENTPTPPTYSVTFPSAGNFKFVCLIHADMTGVVHVVDPMALGAAGTRWARRLGVPAISSYHTNLAAYCDYYHLRALSAPVWVSFFGSSSIV